MYAIERGRLIRVAALAVWVGCAEPATHPAVGQAEDPVAVEHTSGGRRLPEQAAFDVRFYDLEIRIEPADSSITARLEATVTLLAPLDEVVLHLDQRLSVSAAGPVREGVFRASEARHERGLVRVPLGGVHRTGEDITVRIDYAGRPLVSEAPQTGWADGFSWRTTATGEPWIGVVSVLEGADIWWPTVDHPADEPDSMAIHVRVPQPLKVVANGRSRGVDSHEDGTSTHHWFVSTPINNYGVSVNVAPYEVLETSYESVTGERFPFQFWVLPESLDEGRRLFGQMQRDMRFLEELLGPYPFRRDKYAVAQTPYIAMEHQSVIAYGSDFENNAFGFDFYHFHELTHEWWANKLTVADWSDWWLHEGFATYMEALYAEELGGPDAYHEYVAAWQPRITNQSPVVPAANATTHEAYTGDIYRKGASVLHTIRYLIGRDALVTVFRRMQEGPADPGGEACGCRLIDTEEFRRTVEEVTGTDVGRLLDVYLRSAALPELTVTRVDDRLDLRWTAPDGGPFELPVEVRVNDSVERIAMPGGVGSLPLRVDDEVDVDPERWILRAGQRPGQTGADTGSARAARDSSLATRGRDRPAHTSPEGEKIS
ncbi:MAG: M1 family metallopeptidase [Gemmatimonadota bacterium]